MLGNSAYPLQPLGQQEEGLASPGAEGMVVMRKLPGRYGFSLFVSASVLGLGSAAAAQGSHAHDHAAEAAADAAPVAAKTVRWSDPAAWPEGKVPAAGDAVTIAR